MTTIDAVNVPAAADAPARPKSFLRSTVQITASSVAQLVTALGLIYLAGTMHPDVKSGLPPHLDPAITLTCLALTLIAHVCVFNLYLADSRELTGRALWGALLHLNIRALGAGPLGAGFLILVTHILVGLLR